MNMNPKQETLFDCSKKEEDMIKAFSYILTNKCPKITDYRVQIENNVYDLNVLLEEVGIIMRLLQAEWVQVQGTSVSGLLLPYSEISLSRQRMNKFLSTIEASVTLCNNLSSKKRYKQMLTEAVDNFLNYCIPFYELNNDLLLKLTAVNKINKCPLYQYLHCALDTQYYLLIFNVMCEAPVLQQQIEVIMKSLIVLCLNNYKRHHNIHSVFICPCVKYFWLVVQFVIEKTNFTDTFWTIFNKLAGNEEPSFCIHLLKEVASLQSFNFELINEGITCIRIKTNYEFLENKLKAFLLKTRASSLNQLLKLLRSLLINIWIKEGRIDIFQLIWDYYSKRLNISDKNYTNLSAVEFSKLIDTITMVSNPEADFTDDFELFVSMLISHLREYPTHWGKMKGRIYSQLTVNKLKELNETGVTRVTLLFICLSQLYYEEALKKILMFCETFLREKNYPVIWNVYTSFIIQQVKEIKSLEPSAPLMVKLLERAMEDSQKYYLINGFFINFKHILSINPRADLHQWLLFTIKLDKYLLKCYYDDLNVALEVIAFLLEKVNTPDLWPFWKSVFRDNIYPALKKLVTAQNAPKILGWICGKLYFLFLDLANEIFSLLTNEHVLPRVSTEFITVVLDDPNRCLSLSQQQIALILQTWIRNCLLSNNSCKEFTNFVLKLDIFPATLKTHVSTAENPLFALIEYLGSDIEGHLHSQSINTLCEMLFGHIDKWLVQYLSNPEDESVVLRIYTFISLAFLHCGSILYNSKKQYSPVTNLIQAILLPNDFLIGKAPHIFVLNGVKKTWTTFFEALVNLNTNCDMYLERTLRDMITKYVPYFPTADSPMLKCFNQDKSAAVFLEKVSASFFKNPIKESDTNILKVANVLKSFIESNTSVHYMQVIVNKILYGLFEAVIFYAQKNVPISVIKSITNSFLYKEISNEFCNEVIAIADKHLALNTVNCFQLMFTLASFIPADMKNILGVIKQKVANAERVRGVGFDKSLRTNFEKLENIVKDHLKCI